MKSYSDRTALTINILATLCAITVVVVAIVIA